MAVVRSASWGIRGGLPVVLLVLSSLLSSAQSTELQGEESWDPPILPAPQPFTLNSYDVIDAVWLIRRARFLQWWDGETSPRTVVVRRVESTWVGYDPQAYEGHRNRYDVLLNGEALEWDRLYVEYDNDSINLRLLYTYRNQQPPPNLPYRLRWP